MVLLKLDIPVGGLMIKQNKNNQDDYYDNIPICITDIITICREYTKLNWQIQNQMEDILEVGVDEAIENGSVSKASLPYIKNFLKRICDNAYFGDAVDQANDCIELIRQYEDRHKITSISRFN